jgi:hypothetical protein
MELKQRVLNRFESVNHSLSEPHKESRDDRLCSTRSDSADFVRRNLGRKVDNVQTNEGPFVNFA